MIHEWTIVDQATGQVLRSGSTSIEADLPKPVAGEQLVAGMLLSNKDQYWDAGVVRDRPSLDVASSVQVAAGDSAALSLPVGTRILRNRIEVGTATESPVAITSANPQLMRLHLIPPFPYKEQDVNITFDKASLDSSVAARAQARRQAAATGFLGVKV